MSRASRAFRDLGYAAADLLLEVGERIERRQLPHKLVVRGSTAALRT